MTETLQLADGLSREYLLHHRLCPRARSAEGTLLVAAGPDAFLDGVDDIAFAYDLSVTVEQVSAEELDRLIERISTTSERQIELARTADGLGDLDDLTADVRDLANRPPVVRYVNLLVRDAYDAHASDIHLEATRAGLSVRFRLE